MEDISLKTIKKFREYIDSQYGKPKGLLGMYTGEKMVKQHSPETLWTIKLLDMKQDETVLEVGCGAGYAIKLLLEQSAVSLIVGLDISKSVLRSAAIRNRIEIRKGRLQLVKNDVGQLTFQDMSFNKVFSIHSVYFWEDIQKNLVDIYRVLKPEGMVILTLSDGKNGVISEWAKELISLQIIPGMKNCGFRDIEMLRGQNSRDYHIVSIRAKK
jgi:ubiquinone/menaquinone biosynthesis C-methylase UbiE